MIVCTKCGHQNEDDDAFCGSCGDYLEWTGQRVADAETTPEPEAVVDVTDESPEAAAAPAPAERAMAATAAAPAPPDTPGTSNADIPAPTAGGDGGGGGTPRPTAAVLPGPMPVRRDPEPPKRPPRPAARGELTCGDCGEGNPAGRRFCRRCGYSLAEAVTAPGGPAVRLPWWRRLFRREAKVHAAGDRPMRRGGGRAGGGRPAATAGRVLRLVVIVVGALAIIGALGPWRGSIGNALQSVRRTVAPRYNPVNPQAATATSELPGRAAGLAIDPGDDTSWAENAPGNGEGQVLTLTFKQPVDLARIGFVSGAAGKDFLAQPRPRELHIVFSDASTGAGRPVATSDIVLKDKVDFQVFGVDARQVTKVNIEIRSVYAGQQGDATAITDVQFFEKS